MSESTQRWVRVKLGDVVRLNKEKCRDLDVEGIERYVGLEHIEPNDLRVRSWGDVAEGTSFNNRFREGHVLFGKRRAYQRKVAVADFDGVCSGDIYVLESAEPHRLLPEFLPYICQTDSFFDLAVGTSAGSLSPRTNWRSLSKYEFWLPPTTHQERSLHVLEAFEANIAAHRTLEELVREYSTDAIERLTLLSRVSLQGELREGLPTGWRLGRVRELCTLSGGFGFRPKHWSDHGLPIIRIQNLNGSPEFNYYSGEVKPKWLVPKGELLFAWAGVPGVSFGPCLWPGPEGVLNQHIYRVTPREGFTREWLFTLLVALTPRIERKAHGFKKSLLHIKQADLLDEQVPIPPTHCIPDLVSVAREIREGVQSVASRASRLKAMRQAILGHVMRPSGADS